MNNRKKLNFIPPHKRIRRKPPPPRNEWTLMYTCPEGKRYSLGLTAKQAGEAMMDAMKGLVARGFTDVRLRRWA